MNENDFFSARNVAETENISRPRARVLTVSELNRRVRGVLEAGLELLWVGGELSNVVRASSGHWYFSLKDSSAQVRCVMFRNKAALLGFTPENGMQVEVNVLPSLYEPRGEFQLGVEFMRRAGLGALFEAFEKLKAKLSGEGLFDAARKKALPAFPRTVGIVTSLQAAALRDVVTTLRRRAPMVRIVIYPASVQGAAAADEIVAAIKAAGARAECDALILCRGGGSIEDLWPFNEESVARAIAACPVVLVSGVGHETDFTIADFVADRRAPTPTAAAELLSPDCAELSAALAARRATLRRSLQRWQEGLAQRLDGARRGLVSPQERLHRERDRLAALRARLVRSADTRLQARRWELTHALQRLRAGRPDLPALHAALAMHAAHLRQARRRRFDAVAHRLAQGRDALEFLNPQRTLERGYSIVESAAGSIVRDARQAPPGAPLRITFARGKAGVKVTESDNDPAT